MTVKEYRENTSLAQQKILAEMLQCWLGRYTQEVYVKVMRQMDDILSNTFALSLIKELYERTQREIREETHQILFSLGHEEDLEFDIHNHVLTHSDSYRDILYDMYIRDFELK